MKKFRIVIEEETGTTFKYGWQNMPDMDVEDFNTAVKEIVEDYERYNKRPVKSYYIEYKEA